MFTVQFSECTVCRQVYFVVIVILPSSPSVLSIRDKIKVCYKNLNIFNHTVHTIRKKYEPCCPPNCPLKRSYK